MNNAGAQAVGRIRGHEPDGTWRRRGSGRDRGQPQPWQLGMQKGATPVMDDIIWFHDFLLWVITAITLFVLALLVIVVVKFNARSNPVPSRTTHNTLH